MPLAGGFVRWDGVTLEDPVSKIRAAPERRKVGYVFQDARLFPHLSVLENVAFGARGVGRREARERAGTWLRRLGLARSRSGAPRGYPAAKPNEPRSPARSPPNPNYCSSTSPSRRSTRARASSCDAISARSSRIFVVFA
mgnify:CR=1 FL=1